jgi:hypothetical protein
MTIGLMICAFGAMMLFPQRPTFKKPRFQMIADTAHSALQVGVYRLETGRSSPCKRAGIAYKRCVGNVP